MQLVIIEWKNTHTTILYYFNKDSNKLWYVWRLMLLLFVLTQEQNNPKKALNNIDVSTRTPNLCCVFKIPPK